MKRSDKIRETLTEMAKEYREKKLYLLGELNNALDVELKELIHYHEKEAEKPLQNDKPHAL